MSEAPVLEWQECYDDNWKSMIVPAAFAHPAKFARGLVERIVAFGLEQGFWRKGETILDPFAGVGTGGIVCASRGLRWLGVELEERFVALARENFVLHRHTWERFGDPLPVILQGDSRRLGDVLREAGGLVSSPPYAETIDTRTEAEREGDRRHRAAIGRNPRSAGSLPVDGYGTMPGQLGAMPPGSVDAVVSSPPYANEITGQHTEQETARESRAKRKTPGGSLGQSCRNGGYGTSEGNLDNMPAGAVSSPPWENQEPSHDQGGTFRPHHDTTRRLIDSEYGIADGQIGNASGPTFWEAARDVLLSCHAVLASGAVTAWVVKSFVRDRQIVDFPRDWARLLASCGFHVFLEVHASLVRTDEHAGLFGEPVVKTTARKSFFRRLAEKKGSPSIDFEVVLFARKEAAK